MDDDTKLTLHGLQQYFVRLEEGEKNRKLNDLLDALEFNQVCQNYDLFECVYICMCLWYVCVVYI